MSQKFHCDMCDGIIRSDDGRSGTLEIAQRNPQRTTTVALDLCMVHFDALTRLIGLWTTAQKGGYTSDQERINALAKVET